MIPRSKAAHYADLLATSRDPRDVSLRSELLVLAYGPPDAEIAMPDGGTRLLSQVELAEAMREDFDAFPNFEDVAPPHAAALVILSALAVFAALVIGIAVWGV